MDMKEKFDLTEFMDIRSRLLKGSVWNLLATLFNQGSTLAVNIFIARLLGRQIFGEYAMILSTLLTIVGFVQISMGYTTMKYVAEFRLTDKEKTGRILGLCAIVSIVMACFGTLFMLATAPWLATHALKAQHLTTPLIMGTGFLLFSAINGYQIGALAGLESYNSLAKAGMVSGIVAVFVISFGAWWFGLIGAILGLTTTALLRCLFHAWWLNEELREKAIRLQYNSLSHEKRILYKFAIPAAFSGYYSLPAIWLANSILVRQSGGYEQMALYSAANSIRLMVLFLPNVINSVSLSILNQVKGSGDRDRYNSIFRDNVSVIFLTALIAAILAGVFGELILKTFGKDFILGKSVLWLLLFSTAPESVSIGIHQYIQTHEKLWLSFLGINVPRETLFVVTAYLLTPNHGALGLAWSYLIAYIYGLLSHTAILIWIHRYNLSIIHEGRRFDVSLPYKK